jgi:cell division protein FtsQ
MRSSRVSVLPSNRRVSVAELPRNARAPRPPEPSDPPVASSEASKKAKKRKKKRRRKPSRRAKAWLGRLSLLTGIIVVVSASVAVAWGLRRYMRTSPRFAVRHIHVDGTQRRTANQVAKQAQVANGVNIFTIEEDAATAAVEADPWIAEAEVQVELPNTVRISVTEHEARAISVVDGKLLLTDTHGAIFKELSPNDPRDLPVVTGIDADRVARDREVIESHVRRALDLVSDLEQAKITKRYPVQELHLEPNGAVSVTIGSDGIVLVFGQPPFRAKVDKADRILEELRYRKVKRAVLFLDNKAHPERVVVRLQETEKKE